MLADISIVVVLVVSVLLGIFRGALRQLVALGAALVAFIVAAQVRSPIADWLKAQEPDFSDQYAGMIGFILAFLVFLGVALVFIEIGGRTVALSSRPIVDEVVGGALALGVALVSLGALLMALGTYYSSAPVGVTAEVGVLRDLNAALAHSAIANALRDSLVPGLQALLGPLLPADVRFFG